MADTDIDLASPANGNLAYAGCAPDGHADMANNANADLAVIPPPDEDIETGNGNGGSRRGRRRSR